MGICICCCCNKKNTDCIENTLIVFTSIEIVFLIISLILIEWKIAAKINLALNIFILLFLACCLAILIIFKFFREYETIYSKYRKLCYILSYLGMSFSIACIILSILSESLISEKIYQYDHPCINKLSKFKQADIGKISQTSNVKREDNETVINQICESIDDITKISDIFWYNQRSAPKDIIMPYICSTLIEIFSLIGAFLWYNEARRIKYCIKTKLIEEKGMIIYGPLGWYEGINSKKGRNNGIAEIIYVRGNNLNMNLNMNSNKKIININNNISNPTSSSNEFDKNKKIKNEMTNVQNDEIINEIDNESLKSKKSKEKNEKKEKDPSINSDEFYYN